MRLSLANLAVLAFTSGGAAGVLTSASLGLSLRADHAPAPEPIVAPYVTAQSANDGQCIAESPPDLVHLLDNLVVNPAQSRGTRFLLTSIGIEASDPTQTVLIEANEAMLRDAVITVLAAKTVDELMDIPSRSQLKDEIEGTIVSVMGPGVVRGTYLSQFVIQ